MDVHHLTEHDAKAYRDLRLRALQEHPEAFGGSYEEEVQMSPEQWAALLENRHAPTYGAFDGGTLVGIGTLSRNTRPKMRHRTTVVGMYVVPDARGRGAGRAILESLLAHAGAWEGVEDVTLAVTVGNDAARQLYVRSGFSVYSRDPRFLKVGHQHYDLEWMIHPLTQEKAGS